MATRVDEYQLEIKRSALLRLGDVNNFQGTYTPGNSYRSGDLTEFNGEIYMAIADDPVADPVPDPLRWKRLAGGMGGLGNYKEIVVDFNSVTGDTNSEVVSTGIDGFGNATYTFTLASGVPEVKFQIFGGGGGGANGVAPDIAGGGGAAAGFTNVGELTPSAGTVYNLVVGQGGAVGSSGGSSSVTGGVIAIAVAGAGGASGTNGGSGVNGGGGGVNNMNNDANGGSGTFNGGGAGVQFDFSTGGAQSGAALGPNPGSLALASIGGDGRNGLGGKGGSVWWRAPNNFSITGGNGGWSFSPVTIADTEADTSRSGRGATSINAASSPNLPGGGGGGGNNTFPNGAPGSPGRIIIQYVG